MGKKQQQLEDYTTQLFSLINSQANVSQFIDLYTTTFAKAPSDSLVDQYKMNVNAAAEADEYVSDDDESYEESYEESYDEDDDSYC